MIDLLQEQKSWEISLHSIPQRPEPDPNADFMYNNTTGKKRFWNYELLHIQQINLCDYYFGAISYNNVR